MQYSRWGLIRAEKRVTIPSLSLLTTSLLMQPRILFAFLAAKAHCWLMLSFSSTRIPKLFSAGLLSRGYSPSLYTYLELSWSTCNLALGLFKPHWVYIGSPFKFVKVPLDGIPSFSHINCATQLGVVKGYLTEHGLPQLSTRVRMLCFSHPHTLDS